MSAHGSDASQGSHAWESLLAYLFGAFLWPGVPPIAGGTLSGFVFTTGKELPDFYENGLNKGDAIDTAVHLGMVAVAAIIHYLLT